MDATQNSTTISCHCGAARQTLFLKEGFTQLPFCHCDTCRHRTGLLCTSYAPIASHHPPLFAGLHSYSTSGSSAGYFCSTCGCHIFRSRNPSPSAPHEWEVATGVIIDAPESSLPQEWHHQHAQDTKDGGLSPWLPNSDPPFATLREPSQSEPGGDNNNNTTTTLSASCYCTSVTLLITRPSANPTLNPDSPYPDLLLPYHSTPSATISNPSNEKWYLRPSASPSQTEQPNPDPKQTPTKLKYLAGTCACQPCRLTSGFEIQTWAFIPRQNILIASRDKLSHQPLDFSSLPDGVPLKAYSSSPGRAREFCSTCGATIFWHDQFRPGLIDVSAGLLRAPEGARAEDWLEWWAGRVSFSEDAGRGRTGGAKAWGEGVITALEGRLQQRHEQQASTPAGE